MGRSKLYCDCISCQCVRVGALDYRVEDGTFTERNCEFCEFRAETSMMWMESMTVYKPLFVPDAVKEFLGVDWLCETCLACLDYEVNRRLRVCWGTASSDVIELAVLKVMHRIFVSAISHNSPRAVAERKDFAVQWAEWEKQWKQEEVQDIVITINPRVRVTGEQQ